MKNQFIREGEIDMKSQNSVKNDSSRLIKLIRAVVYSTKEYVTGKLRFKPGTKIAYSPLKGLTTSMQLKILAQ
jgi:hypothetical protein